MMFEGAIRIITIWLAMLFLMILCVQAFPREQYDGQFDKVEPKIRQWFQNYNNKGSSCCSEADCHPGLDFQIVGDHYEVYIEELKKFVPVPEDKVVLDQGNPTGGAVACYLLTYQNAEPAAIHFYCFTPGDMTMNDKYIYGLQQNLSSIA